MEVSLVSSAQRSKERRRGFTLVEMLVVVAIIGILASLITAVAFRAQVQAKVTVVQTELNMGLGAALERYKQEHGEYPPDFTDQAAVLRHLKKRFPRWRYSGSPLAALPNGGQMTPAAALVFWLGGPSDGSTPPKLLGFSANQKNPFDISPTRIQPTFDFDRERLTRDASGMPVYCSPSVTVHPNHAYVYFRANPAAAAGAEYLPTGITLASGETVTPFYNDKLQEWVNPKGFQIISPGFDMKFGATVDSKPGQFPSGLNYGPAMFDNICNFGEGTLESSQP